MTMLFCSRNRRIRLDPLTSPRNRSDQRKIVSKRIADPLLYYLVSHMMTGWMIHVKNWYKLLILLSSCPGDPERSLCECYPLQFSVTQLPGYQYRDLDNAMNLVYFKLPIF